MNLVRRRRAARGSGAELRDEILDAATELLLESGNVKAVSIRSVAEHVGVTPPSIYLHFADKDALLDAVCGRYFEQLDEVMQQVAAEHITAVDKLRAQGLAYVRFARQNPELYRVAMMAEGGPGSDVDVALTTAAFTHMRDSVQALMDEGSYPREDVTVVALGLWAAAHGVAGLLVSRPYLPFGDPEEFADRVLGAACLGGMVRGLSPSAEPATRPGPDATPQATIDRLKGLHDD